MARRRKGDRLADAREAARMWKPRLGAPDLGVVLGSGFSPLAAALGASERVPLVNLPGYPRGAWAENGRGLARADRPGGAVWVFETRLHIYQGLDAAQVTFPIRLLKAAGARAVLLTCAAGGLAEADRPGDLALVTDHINLTAGDPLRAMRPAGEEPSFLDLHRAYDPAMLCLWRAAAGRHGVPLRDGVLAALPGPSYETPAEVRMLRLIGADLVSMSTVPEVIAARGHDLRVAAIACVANRGAGMAEDGHEIRHAEVVDRVDGAIRRSQEMLLSGIDSMLADI